MPSFQNRSCRHEISTPCTRTSTLDNREGRLSPKPLCTRGLFRSTPRRPDPRLETVTGHVCFHLQNEVAPPPISFKETRFCVTLNWAVVLLTSSVAACTQPESQNIEVFSMPAAENRATVTCHRPSRTADEL